MEKKTTCRGCDHCSLLKVNIGGDKNYHNIYCTKSYANSKRLVDVSIPEDKEVPPPTWCPINKAIEDAVIINGIQIPKKTWGDLKPQVEFTSIKVGDVYHIPPFNGRKRMDVVVTSATNYSVSFRQLSKSNVNIYDTIYPNTPISRFLVPHKIQTIEVKKP